MKRGALRSSLRSWPKTLPYLRPHRALVGVSMALMALGALVSLAEPWPLALMIDSVLGDKPLPPPLDGWIGQQLWARVVLVMALLLLVTLAVQGLAVVNGYINTKIDMRMVLDFRSDLFRHVQRLSFDYHDERRTGEFMGRINQQASSLGAVTVSAFPLVQSTLTLAGMLFVAYRINPPVALLSMSIVPFIYYSSGYYGSRIGPQVRKVKGMEIESLHIVHEAVQMIRVIVAFNREKESYAKFRTQGEAAVDARVKLTVRQTMFSLVVSLITAAGTAAVLGLGAYQVVKGNLTTGQLLVLLAYIRAAYAPLETISSTVNTIQEQLIGFEMSLELLDTAPDVNEKPDAVTLDPVRGDVVYEDVSFAYQGREHTLDRVSFHVEAGESVAVVGRTGAGKSTLVSLLPRFYDPAGGRILLDGVDIRDLTLESLRSQISLVLQEPLLFSGTIAENIRYGRLDATDEEVRAAAKAANAHEFIAKLPKRYGTKLGERGAKLSGGERQRISVARAFLKDSPILILDEPTSSIDSRTEAVILEALGRLMEGRTTFMIAHRLSTVRNASQILVVDDGRLLERGTHEELLELDGAYRMLHDAQRGRDVGFFTPVLADAGAGAAGAALVTRPRIVVLGMMTKMPVAGVVWQNLHYLLGFERLGYEAWYVEAHGITPSAFCSGAEGDLGSVRAADFIHRTLDRVGLGAQWAYHALHDDGAVHGIDPARLRELYRSAAVVVNLHGGTIPSEDHASGGPLVYLETDPCRLQAEIAEGSPETLAFLAPHSTLFSFGERYGMAGCGLPITAGFTFLPTRQPVVVDLWEGAAAQGDTFTTIGNWRQRWRDVTIDGEPYTWSKHHEFARVLDLPSRTGARLELALAGYRPSDEAVLTRAGWHVRTASSISADPDTYRSYVAGSLGEFTVAKDQNVRLRTGWFSDRSATYLAAGRPVITQDTGFGDVLPVGEGLLAFSTVEEAAAAVAEVEADPIRHGKAASAVAREHFEATSVLRHLLDRVR